LVKRIDLNQGKFVLVDDEDYQYINQWNWTYNPHGGGYASRTDRSQPRQKTILMHRELMKAKKGQQVDHINRNRLDNRRSNLRICTPGDNSRNAGKRKDGISKYKGVYKREDNGYFVAHIQFNQKRLFLGYYTDELNAAYYYNQKATELFREYAYLNELPEGFKPTEPYKPNLARGKHSEYRGVTYSKKEKKFRAYIQHEGKRINIGGFMTDRIAAEMYNTYAIELHGENAILNEFEQCEGVIANGR
jgi:hypothetical protein